MEENQTTFSRQESLQKSGGGGSNFFWLLVPVVLAILIGGGFFFFRSRQETEEVVTFTPTPTSSAFTPTPEPEETPMPTPTKQVTSTPKPTPIPTPQRVATTAAELKRQAISVQVLNGTGVAGVAKKAADYLASFFYIISNVGNAENYNFEKTVIQTKKAADLDLLKADLENQYEIGSASATLPSSSSYDAVVIIGKK